MSMLFVFFLSTWLLLSALVQFKHFRWVQKLRHKDIFALLPYWHFFAPNPGITEFKLLYRDKLLDDQYTLWREVVFEPHSRWRGIWNPGRRLGKALTQMCSSILYFAKDQKKARLLVSVPYIILLEYVMSLPASHSSESRQFLIAITFGYHTVKQSKIVFVSSLHPCGAAL